ncbi:ABC transporter permease [Microbacterium karelineae]|uniref:ABC transporter permease n=1 Tax=Microbacterium karelineae TaxID=2654283 RepID=UPI0012E9C0A7|nr:hypothetical protein [Microbacterium karelineae]
MTLAANTLPLRGPVARPGTLTGVGALIRHIVRRDRVRMTVWALSIAAFIAYFAVALTTVFDAAALAARAAVMRTPSGIVMGGPGYGLDDYTAPVAIANEGITWIVLALAIMSIAHVVRHTRAEEESARAELIRAAPVGRHAAAVAALVTLAAHLIVIAALGAAALVALGDEVPVPDAVALMLGSAVSALVFGAVALVTAQISEHARAASGLALAVFGVFFVIRAAGDLQETGGSPLSWFSPIAWAQQTRPFVDLRWWPIALGLAATALLLALAAVIASRRDVGAGLLPARRGRAAASRALSSPFALAWRQQRAALAWTAAGLGLLWFGAGTMMSTLDDMMSELVASNAAFGAMFGEDPTAFTASFLGVMALFAGICAAAYAIGAGLRPGGEEASGRLELVAASAVSRAGWFAAQLAVAALGALAVIAVSIGALWAGVVVVGIEDPGVADFARVLAFTAPAVLVFLAATATLYAWVPRAAGAAWAVLAVAFAIGMFGPLFELPDAVLRLSPFHGVSGAFLDDADIVPPIVLAAITAALFALALVGFHRREVRTG